MGKEDDLIQNNKDTVYEIKDEDGAEEEGDKSVEVDDPSIETVDNEEESRGNDEQPTELEKPAPPRPPAVRKLDSALDGKHWEDNMVGSVIHEYCIGSVIRDYGNFEAALSTPQYGFQKRMKAFRKKGYEATTKELDKNFISKHVINMLPARLITHTMMQ